MSEINASVITIGDELLIGQTIDTNSAFIGQELNKAGIWVKRRVAVGDVYSDIWNALDEEKKYSRLIIITGGLGPTADDITKPLLCDYFNTRLVRNETVLAHIHHLFVNVYKRKVALSEANIRQADLPESCTVLHNEHGSAAGMWFETENRNGEKVIVISMPGVPYEMKKILVNEALPRITAYFGGDIVIHKVLSTFGMGESMVAEKLATLESQLPSYIKLAYLPGYGMVKLRLTGRGNDRIQLEEEMSRFYQQLKAPLKHITIAENDDTLEMIIGQLLQKQQKKMATAESCTGGYIAHLITSLPKSSSHFNGSAVTYNNKAKENILGVNHETLETQGAVSEETAIQMVAGALERFDADYALATTGIMGPASDNDEKPVGTVWIAAGNRQHIVTKQLNLGYDRQRNIQSTALQALNLLRKFVIDQGGKE
ncbi:CinA family nicotinamide mononucleotide deamidase-related protein [Niabella yanshanensis]|uniref:CinA-like protein n=1 Tax=Niabella yanshanensis TaxID=577386 RepID=A0ABZ0WAW2_9BACT|nr:CinA family nicotinamide mononucleotide deamidase-related protein [Niabella yanshanensis]WQD40326.1 CinA family nicotinamide mononucleotide deamidase-related protein [Niabella yanshanensis]